MSVTRFTGFSAAIILLATIAFAQERPPATPPHNETPDMGPAPRGPTLESPPYVSPRGAPNAGVQVNTNSSGNNILNDAANEPSLAVDPTRRNRIAIGWRQFNTISSNFRQAGRAWSRDSGRTWTNPGPLTPGVFRSDPVLRSDSAGVFYYYSLSTTQSCEFFKSTNGGQTWTAPIPAFGGDKAWFTIDTTGGQGDGNIDVAWSEFAGCCGDDIFIRSTNDAVSFSAPQPYPPNGGAVFGTLDIGPNGELYSIGTQATTFGSTIFTINRSTNAANPAVPVVFDLSRDFDFGGGIGFGSPMVNPDGLLGQAQVVVDRSGGSRNGWVYGLCSVTLDPNNPAGDPMDVHLVRSTDGGNTWSAPIKIGDDPPGVNAWQWFGTIGIAPNGRLDVVWNDTKVAADPRNPTHSQTLYSFSTDGGSTWSTPEEIGLPWNHLVGFPQQNKIGDYYDIWSDNVGANLIYAATFNGEEDVYFRRLGDYDCNGNDVGDALDVSSGSSTDVNVDGIPDECQCIGDLDGSFTIELGDLAAFLAHFGTCMGQPGYLAAADFNHSNCIDLADLAALLGNFGRICP